MRAMPSLTTHPKLHSHSQRQEIDAIKHNNEVIRLDAIRGTRDAKINVKSGAAQEVARLQDQAEMYFQRIQVEKVQVTTLLGGGLSVHSAPALLPLSLFTHNRGRLGSWKSR